MHEGRASRTFIGPRKPSDTGSVGQAAKCDFEMGTRQKTAEPTDLKESLDFAADAGRGWTAQEEDIGERRRHAVIQSLLPLNEVIQLPNFFDALDIVLLSVDRGTAEALRDANGDLIKYNFGNTNWIPLMLRNSSFIIQPEEILADNFATLMEWAFGWRPAAGKSRRLPTHDVDLLIAMEGVLASGCKRLPAASLFQHR
jgi:hypothetical protein